MLVYLWFPESLKVEWGGGLLPLRLPAVEPASCYTKIKTRSHLCRCLMLCYPRMNILSLILFSPYHVTKASAVFHELPVAFAPDPKVHHSFSGYMVQYVLQITNTENEINYFSEIFLLVVLCISH